MFHPFYNCTIALIQFSKFLFQPILVIRLHAFDHVQSTHDNVLVGAHRNLFIILLATTAIAVTGLQLRQVTAIRCGVFIDGLTREKFASIATTKFGLFMFQSGEVFSRNPTTRAIEVLPISRKPLQLLLHPFILVRQLVIKLLVG